MLRSCATLFTLLLIVSVSTSYADTYSWTDDQGTINFTEDLGSVPKKFRKKARKTQEEAPPEAKSGSAAATGKAPKATPPVADSRGWSADDTFAGKTHAQWTKDLRDRDEAMAAVRKEIDEIDTQLSKPATRTKALLDQRAALLAQFKQMKSEYDQVIESARKAGLQVNIEK